MLEIFERRVRCAIWEASSTGLIDARATVQSCWGFQPLSDTVIRVGEAEAYKRG